MNSDRLLGTTCISESEYLVQSVLLYQDELFKLSSGVNKDFRSVFSFVDKMPNEKRSSGLEHYKPPMT